MKKLILLAFALFASQSCFAQLSPADLKGFQRLLEAPKMNPLRDCADAGLRKLYIYRVVQITKKPDAEVEREQFASVEDENLLAQLKAEVALWKQTRLPNAVAQTKLDACLQQVGLPTSESLSRLTRHCFGNALFAIDVLQAKDIQQPVEELKARMKQVKAPLSTGQVDSFIDEMYRAKGKEEEMALSRELFSSCLGANNGRY
jgi:hypothetical protein